MEENEVSVSRIGGLPLVLARWVQASHLLVKNCLTKSVGDFPPIGMLS